MGGLRAAHPVICRPYNRGMSLQEDDLVTTTELVEIAEERGTGDITRDEKAAFLELVRQGLDRREAAMALGYTARPWRALTSPRSPFYDDEFTTSYSEAIGSPEKALHYQERVREEFHRRAMTDSDRLLRDLAMVHLPEFAVLRQKDVNVNARVVFEQELRELPTELLRRIYAELGDGDEVIEDAEVLEIDLPPAVDEDDAP